VAAEVFGWNAEAGDATGSAWAEDAIPPPPFDWSEEALEDQLEQELAALDPPGGLCPSQPTSPPPPSPTRRPFRSYSLFVVVSGS